MVGTADTMIIAQISDTHIALDVPDADRRLSDFARCIADINALDPPPDVIVHSGDVAHNGRRDEYAEAATILRAARAPVYVLAGNKDDRSALREAFSGGGYLPPDFDFIQYAIEGHPVRLLALDTVSPGNKGAYCRERLEHLAGLIAADPTKPIVVFTHHPSFTVTVGPEPMHFEDRHPMSQLNRVLAESGRVVAICSGHVHREAFGDIEGIPASVTTSVATSLRYGNYPEPLRHRPTYHVHRFDPVSEYTVETRVAGGM